MSNQEKIKLAIEDLQQSHTNYKHQVMMTNDQRLVNAYRIKIESIEYVIKHLNEFSSELTQKQSMEIEESK
jgi:hypothetical protein